MGKCSKATLIILIFAEKYQVNDQTTDIWFLDIIWPRDRIKTSKNMTIFVANKGSDNSDNLPPPLLCLNLYSTIIDSPEVMALVEVLTLCKFQC